jgi:isoleucyl-tRNA synthetase
MRYSKEWETTVKRMGRWIDFKRDYKVYKINKDFRS